MNGFVISQTPYRVSFFGGGTDYPAWYRENPGAVLATSIDKYCYLMCRWLPPFFDHKYMISYSEIEKPQEISEIRHPAIREVLKYHLINEGVGIHHAGDLPARAGMGTSSAFTVGLLNAIYALKKFKLNKLALALDAIYVEQEMVKEAVGSQDQTTSAFGGFNRIDFSMEGQLHKIKVTPVETGSIKKLEKRLMLFFTGFSRTASKVARKQIDRVRENAEVLKRFYDMVSEAESILTEGEDLAKFGKLLGESWELKKQLSSAVSTEYIDYLYNSGIDAGATAGKLLGAGGGGFLLFFVEPDAQENVKGRLSSLLLVPFKFESGGSRIIYKGD